jgi:hypothetical protein
MQEDYMDNEQEPLGDTHPATGICGLLFVGIFFYILLFLILWIFPVKV